MAKMTVSGEPILWNISKSRHGMFEVDTRGDKWLKYKTVSNGNNIRNAVVNSIIDNYPGEKFKDSKIEVISNLELDIEDIKLKGVKSITAKITFILSDNETNK